MKEGNTELVVEWEPVRLENDDSGAGRLRWSGMTKLWGDWTTRGLQL